MVRMFFLSDVLSFFKKVHVCRVDVVSFVEMSYDLMFYLRSFGG